ncbi:MAG: M20 aminoacylase family protein [Rhodobacterales bacterium]|jgi:amidohydrolase
MPIINRISDYYNEMKEWRQYIHSNPELGFECHQTAAFVVERLREFGIEEIHEGIAKTGVVAIINGSKPGKTIGLRADMDALPLQEIHDHEYKSKNPGKMHACGHDGHTTMLLGAARYLAETRNFSGRVALIFQPAEEGGGGGEVMVKEGIIDTFAIDQIYGIHNAPGIPLGVFVTNPGPAMAAADEFEIEITGQGGHGAAPEETVDPIVICLQVAQSIQTISSRNLSALDPVVISITQIHTGTTHNIIPGTAYINGTVRTLTKASQEVVVNRLQKICEGHAIAFNGEVSLDYQYGYPPTVNHLKETEFAVEVAKGISGPENVDGNALPIMAAEDFSYMLEKCPGSYLQVGQGDGPPVHNPEYDFNDDLSPIGASFYVGLVEKAQPLD